MLLAAVVDEACRLDIAGHTFCRAPCLGSDALSIGAGRAAGRRRSLVANSAARLVDILVIAELIGSIQKELFCQHRRLFTDD